MFLPKYPVKPVTQHPAQVFVAPGMHLDSLLQKPLMQTCPLQHFLLSSFPSLLKSCGTNHYSVSLGHNCPSLILNNIPEPVRREQAAVEHSCMGSHHEGREAPPLSLIPVPPHPRHRVLIKNWNHVQRFYSSLLTFSCSRLQHL